VKGGFRNIARRADPPMLCWHPPASDFSSNDLDQQTSQVEHPASGAQEPPSESRAAIA